MSLGPATSSEPSRLTPDECRILGVLVEKAQTTPAQYPLSLNGVVVGCNQKNNRNPVMNIDEDRAFRGLDGLKAKQLVREVSLTGSRVEKFRHVARETLCVSTSELVIIAELLLRGPQTIGELRGNASRMHSLESIEVVKNVLDNLATRTLGDEATEGSGGTGPLVREIAPSPGSRATRYVQLLCPDLHFIDTPSGAKSDCSPSRGQHEAADTQERLDRLEREVSELKDRLDSLMQQFGG